jgi:AcrR family transcriptional regulator
VSPRATPARKRRLRAPARRARIAEAALEVFAQRGYAATSMGEVASAAGTTRTVLYDHFASKRELFLWLLEGQAAELLEDVGERMVGEAPPRERMRQTIDAFLASVEAHPFAWRLLLRESTGDPGVVAAHRRIAADANAAVRALLAADLERAGVAPESERAAVAVELIIAAVLGVASWWGEHRDVARGELVDVVMLVLWNGLGRLG